MNEFSPCPVCKSDSIGIVVSRKGDSVKCKECGFTVPVDAPRECELTEWMKYHIEKWNSACSKTVIGIDLAQGHDFCVMSDGAVRTKHVHYEDTDSISGNPIIKHIDVHCGACGELISRFDQSCRKCGTRVLLAEEESD